MWKASSCCCSCLCPDCSWQDGAGVPSEAVLVVVVMIYLCSVLHQQMYLVV
jgi:hypothetical protein